MKNLINSSLNEFKNAEITNEDKLPPKPKVGDSVEMIDMSKTFGMVKKVVNDDEVEVDWGSEEGEEGIKVEKITDLALVGRKE